MTSQLTQMWRALASVALVLGLGVATSGCQSVGSRSWWPWGAASSVGSKADPGATTSFQKLKPRQQADQMFSLARSLEVNHQWEQAAQGYEVVLGRCEDHAAAHHRLAIVSERLQDPEKAERHFARALALDPKNPELLADWGLSLYLRDQWAESEANLTAAIAQNPKLNRAHNALGLVQARTGRDAEALASFRRAGCSPAEARANLAFALLADGRWREAESQLHAGLNENPDSKLLRDRLREVQQIVARAGQSPRDVLPASYQSESGSAAPAQAHFDP